MTLTETWASCHKRQCIQTSNKYMATRVKLYSDIIRIQKRNAFYTSASGELRMCVKKNSSSVYLQTVVLLLCLQKPVVDIVIENIKATFSVKKLDTKAVSFIIS